MRSCLFKVRNKERDAISTDVDIMKNIVDSEPEALDQLRANTA